AGSDDGGVDGLTGVLVAPPEHRAGVLVERGQGALLAARRADDPVAVDQHRLAVAPAAGHLAGEVLAEVDLPADFAVLRRDTEQFAVAGQTVEVSAVDRRGAARAVAVAVGVKGADLGGPELLLGLQVEGEDELLLAVAAQGVEGVADDGGA